jgi:hypothetical protein
MRENRTSGTVAGAPGNRSPYAGEEIRRVTPKGVGVVPLFVMVLAVGFSHR